NIRCHRDAPTGCGGRACVKYGITQRRQYHSPERRHDRQRGIFEGRKFADQYFTFQFETNQQEKEGHEPVVYPLMHRKPETPPLTREQRQRLLGESMDGIGAECRSKEKRGNRRGDQYDTARGSTAKKLLER